MTDSVPVISRLTQSTDSYGRTDGRTNEEPLDLGDSLTLRNAHENDADLPQHVTTGTPLRDVPSTVLEGYCTEYGHEYYRIPCRGCRAEALAAGMTDPRDASRAAHIRTLTREPDRTPDARERAAGLDREKDTDV